MHVRMIAVGQRMPGWVRVACDDYVARLGPAMKLSLIEIEAGSRSPGQDPRRAIASEGRRLIRAVRQHDYVVCLDERGTQMSTRELAGWLETRRREGADLAFLIGGPDGLAAEALERSNLTWSLSRLTLPHALVRVLLAEQLYRAHSVLTHHPYHRD